MLSNSYNFDENYVQERTFVNNSSKEYIPMSDGEDIFCYHSIDYEKKGDLVFFFVQGYASGIFPWSDFWDALDKEFNLVVLDPRDKPTNKLTKKSECTTPRIALDIAETLHHLRIDEKNVVLFGSSIGASYVAHCVNKKMVNPLTCFLTGPSIIPRSPRLIVKIILPLPPKLLKIVGTIVARVYLKNRVSDGFQKQIFYERIKNVDVRRWKICKKLQDWDATEDFAGMEGQVFIIRTKGDKYHKIEDLNKANQLIKNSKIVDVPSYEFIHMKPGVYDFTIMLKKIIEDEILIKRNHS